MSQFNTPVRRVSGGLDVYAALLFVAFLILAAGVTLLALRNTEHSGIGNNQGGMIKLID